MRDLGNNRSGGLIRHLWKPGSWSLLLLSQLACSDPTSPPDAGLAHDVDAGASVDAGDAGSLVCPARLDVSPLEIDFGVLWVGDRVHANLIVSNTGCRDLVFDEVTLISDGSDENGPDESAFGFVAPVSRGDEIAPGASAAIGLFFAPSEAGEPCATLMLRTNDPVDPDVEVRLCGQATTCIAEIARVGDVPYTGQPIHVGDDVLFSAARSSGTLPVEILREVTWELIDMPPGGQVSLSSTNEVEVRFRTGSATGPEVPGTYRLRASVYSDYGASQCELSFDVVEP